MWRYFVRKMILLVITIALLTILSFSLLHLMPGNPLMALMPDVSLSLSERDALISHYALDKGFMEQYFNYLQLIWHGDLGVSRVDQIPISEQMLSSFTATMQLAISALLFAILLGIPLGIVCALYPRSLFDRIITSINLVGQSIPVFWWALMLILVFALGLHWFPISGRISLLFDIPETTGILLFDIFLAEDESQAAALWSALRHLALPTLAVSIIPISSLTQFTRSCLLDVQEQNYIQAARAKGVSRFNVLMNHALPNACGNLLRHIGSLANPILTATIIVEYIFSWPGAGRWLIHSLIAKDVLAIQACMLTISIFVICLYILTDLLAAWTTPYERHQHNG